MSHVTGGQVTQYQQFPIFDVPRNRARSAAIGEGATFAVTLFVGEVRGIQGVRNTAAYSVFFETTIPKLGIGSRPAHFSAANQNLAAAMKVNPDLDRMAAGLGIQIPRRLGQSPAGWSWHHVPDRPGVMQLVPRGQHQGSAWQPMLHPNRQGGYKLWGKDY
jgi:hypothetical protein